MTLILQANLAATWFMVGVIWFVQLVHYPQFTGVGGEGFAAYHRRHQRFTTFVVAGPMLVEAITALALVVRPGAVAPALAWTGLALVGLIWLSTAALQVPRHRDLARDGFSGDACARLCRSNWVRTIAWTARGVLMIAAIGR